MRTSIFFSVLALSLAACGTSRMSDDGGADAHVGTDGGGDATVADGGDAGTHLDGAVDAPMADAPSGDAIVSDAPMGDAIVSDAPMGDMATMGCPEGDLGMMVGVAVRTGTTVGATAMLTPSCDSGGPAPALRFTWTAPTTGMYAIDTLGSGYDTVLAVLDATCTGTELDCNDDSSGGFDNTSRIDATVTAGHVYVIEVAGYDGASGTFTLSITQPAADETGACHDMMDNDRDGFVDCLDSDCSADPTCTETNCTNGVDDDMDGNTDCADSDCSGLPICVAPLCGNGITDSGETCDDSNGVDGDGCSRFCQVEPLYSCTGMPSVCVFTCGNGTLDTATGEECDDGNTTAGDRCDATCVLESTTGEAEPNDDLADATTVADGNRVRGSLSSATDVDLFTFTLTAPAQLDVETYTTVDADHGNYDGTGTCGPIVDCPTDDTVVRLFAATGDVTMDATAIASDDNGGDGNCSYLGAGDSTAIYLQPGTYTIKLTGAAVPLYIMDVRLTAGVAPTAGNLVINEYMANPGTTTDTNCDGVLSSNDDEFVELVNTTATFLDLTGATISDQMMTPTVRHTFVAGGLAPHAAVVVYGGGIAACTGVNGQVALASPAATGHSLSLNNTNDGITVADATGTVLASLMYATSIVGVSANLSPDLNDTVAGTDTGPFVRHNLVAGAVGNFSPGKRVDGTAF